MFIFVLAFVFVLCLIIGGKAQDTQEKKARAICVEGVTVPVEYLLFVVPGSA